MTTTLNYFMVLNTNTGTVHVQGDSALLCGRPVSEGIRYASVDAAKARTIMLTAPKPCGKCARGVGLVTPIHMNAGRVTA